MSNFERRKVNPVEMLKNQFGIESDNITFDPSLRLNNCQYHISRQQSHDGTTFFTGDMIAKILSLLVNEESCCKRNEPDKNRKVIGIKYTVGYLRISTVYGMVELSGRKYPGQKERMRIPVIAEYVYA